MASQTTAKASSGQAPRDPRLVCATEIDSLPQNEYIDGFENELPKQGLVVTYGPSGQGKTHFALQRGLKVAQQANVVYVANEGLSGIGPRIKAIADYYGWTLSNFYIWRDSLDLMKSDTTTDFVKKIQFLKPALLIVDPLVDSMVGGDDSNTKDMNTVTFNVKECSRRLSCCAEVVHHTGKDGKLERGSTVLRGKADLMIKIVHKDKVTVTCDKSRNAEKFPARHYKLIKHLDSVILVADGAISGDKLKILRALDQPAGLSSLLITTKIKRSTLHRLLDQLKGSGHVRQPKAKGPYERTAKGTHALPKVATQTVKSQSPKSDPAKVRLQKEPKSTKSQKASASQPSTNGNSGKSLDDTKSQVSPDNLQPTETETPSSLTNVSPYIGRDETESEIKAERWAIEHESTLLGEEVSFP